jgi:cell shape-determining protein MreC
MSYITSQGRAYTLQDLERLVSIESFGSFNGAVAGLIQRTKFLERENEALRASALLAESYKQQLLQMRHEVESLKK